MKLPNDPRLVTVVMPFADLDAIPFPMRPKSEGGGGFLRVAAGDQLAVLDEIRKVLDDHQRFQPDVVKLVRIDQILKEIGL